MKIPTKIKFLIYILFVLIYIFYSKRKYGRIIDIEPIIDSSIFQRNKSAPSFDKMLESHQIIDDIHVMTYYGNFLNLIKIHHHEIIDNYYTKDSINNISTNCSIFSYFQDSTALFGRNYDNRPTDLLIGYFYPDSGYSSVALIPMTEFGFSSIKKYKNTIQLHKQILLTAPLVAFEGMNEKGVTLALASFGKEFVNHDFNKPSRYLFHLVREILDYADNVDKAIEIAQKYNIFDNGLDFVQHHILISDPEKKSVILEWNDGEMQIIRKENNFQIATNSQIFKTSETEKKKCNRYNTIFKKLHKYNVDFSPLDAMDILKKVKQKRIFHNLKNEEKLTNTQWSAVFDMQNKEIFICIHSDYTKIYKLKIQNS